MPIFSGLCWSAGAWGRTLGVLALVLCALVVQPSSTWAQGLPAETAKSLEPFLEKARKAGSTVIVVSPKSENQAAAEEKAEQVNLPALMNRAQFRFRQVLRGAGQFVSNAGDAFTKVSTEGNLNWLWWALGVSILSLVAGRFLGSRLNLWARDAFSHIYADAPQDRATKIAYLLFRGFMMTVTALAAAAFAALVVWVIAYGYRETLVTGSRRR